MAKRAFYPLQTLSEPLMAVIEVRLTPNFIAAYAYSTGATAELAIKIVHESANNKLDSRLRENGGGANPTSPPT